MSYTDPWIQLSRAETNIDVTTTAMASELYPAVGGSRYSIRGRTGRRRASARAGCQPSWLPRAPRCRSPGVGLPCLSGASAVPSVRISRCTSPDIPSVTADRHKHETTEAHYNVTCIPLLQITTITSDIA